MEWWYRGLALLPFEWAQYGEMNFLKNALLALIIVAPLFGIVGTMIVNNKMAFFSDALGHGAFTGIVTGAFFGFMETSVSAIFFSILFALGITLVKQRTKMAGDTVIGVFSSVTIALGIFLATYGGNSFSKLTRYLIGDILSITPSEIWDLFLVLCATLGFWIMLQNKLLMVSVSSSLALSRRLNIFWVEAAFAAVVAVIVTISMSFVGLLVINSFLVLPATAARNVAVNFRQYHWYAIGIALVSGISGLLISYYTETVAGATIVLIAALLFLSTFALRKKYA